MESSGLLQLIATFVFCLQGQFKFDAEIDTPLSEQDRKVRIVFVVEKIVCLLSGLFGKKSLPSEQLFRKT